MSSGGRQVIKSKPNKNLSTEPHENEGCQTPKHPGDTEDIPASFFDVRNLRVASVQAVGGTLNGYSIGFVGVYSTLYGFSTDCSKFKGGQTACETVPNANCKWFPTSGTVPAHCGWPDLTCRTQYPNGAAGGTDEAARVGCLADSHCKWSYSDKECQNPSGYSSTDSGIFAGSMILGCLFGSLFAGPLATRIGSRLSFLLVGIVGIVCSILYHISAATNQFWVLIAGRFVIGLFLGVVSVACPMYTDQNGHPKYKRMLGVLFQVFTTFGIFLAATIGLALGQSVWFDKDKDQQIMARQQGLAVFSTFLSLLMVALGVLVTESRAKFNASDAKDGDVALDANEFSVVQMLPRLLMGAVMAGTLQLTGINAVMNYAPTIMGNLGLAPLVGNFVVMTWNFITTFVSIPLASMFTMRQLFLMGSMLTSAMCLFMCGIPVYPDVSKTESAKNGVAITGILLFIMFFEFAVGPCFYVLTMDMYPPSFRPKGASITQVMQFIFNLIINVCYPIATENISGGPSGNQDKGQAIAFIFFGCIGLVCFVVQVFFLHPYEGHDIGDVGENGSSLHKENGLPHVARNESS